MFPSPSLNAWAWHLSQAWLHVISSTVLLCPLGQRTFHVPIKQARAALGAATMIPTAAIFATSVAMNFLLVVAMLFPPNGPDKLASRSECKSHKNVK
jgi:hypothetical protein